MGGVSIKLTNATIKGGLQNANDIIKFIFFNQKYNMNLVYMV